MIPTIFSQEQKHIIGEDLLEATNNYPHFLERVITTQKLSACVWNGTHQPLQSPKNTDEQFKDPKLL